MPALSFALATLLAATPAQLNPEPLQPDQPFEPALPTYTPTESVLLNRIRQQRDGDNRRFGACNYRWDSWKLNAGGVRTTGVECDGSDAPTQVAVACSSLTINTFRSGTWGAWRLPAAGAEELMVARLCANTLPAPATTTQGTTR